MFQETFKGGSREVQGHLKEVRMVFQGSFKVVSKTFQESFIGVSRKFQKKFQGCIKKVLIEFCFAILLLHGSHRSYPSRRRACLCCLHL